MHCLFDVKKEVTFMWSHGNAHHCGKSDFLYRIYSTSRNFSVICTNDAFFPVFSQETQQKITKTHTQVKSVSLSLTAILVLYSQRFVYDLILNWVIQICAKTFQFWRRRFSNKQNGIKTKTNEKKRNTKTRKTKKDEKKNRKNSNAKQMEYILLGTCGEI